MNKINLVKQSIIVIIILFLFSTVLYSQTKSSAGFISKGHDSLLFDGDDANLFIISKEPDDKCNIKVVGVENEAMGTYIIDTIYKACGKEERIKVQKTGLLKSGMILVPGYEITTGSKKYNPEGSFINQLALNIEGSVLVLSSRASIMVGNDCVIHVTKGVVAMTGKYDIITPRSKVLHKETQYTIEVVEDGEIITDILRVYEGSVSFGLNMQNKSNINKTQDITAEMKKLTDDFKSGKISIVDFTNKMAELQKEMNETTSLNTVTVNAGYESKIVGTGINPTEPVAFDTNDNRWWEK